MTNDTSAFEKIWSDTIASGTFKKLETGKQLAEEFYKQTRKTTIEEILALLPETLHIPYPLDCGQDDLYSMQGFNNCLDDIRNKIRGLL